MACAHGPGMSRVQVICPPGAEVFIDGDLRGLAQGEAEVSRGPFQIRCQDPNTGTWRYQRTLIAKRAQERFDFGKLEWQKPAASAPVPEPPEGPGALSKQELFKVGAPATVLIIAYKGQTGIGTGVVVSRDGLVVTNKHVTSGARKLLAFMYDPKAGPTGIGIKDLVKARRKDALLLKPVREHPDLDLALLQLPKDKGPYSYLEPHSAAELVVGDEVVAIGNPDGLPWTLSSGNISQLRKNAIQHQAPINPGNSGGPLLDQQGRLVGINTFIRNSVERQGNRQVALGGLGFALPADAVVSLVRGGSIFAETRPAEADGDDGKWTDSRIRVALLTGALSPWLASGPKPRGLQATADVLAAAPLEGRCAFTGALPGPWLNAGLAASVAALPADLRGRAWRLLANTWPRGFQDEDGHLWLYHRDQGEYVKKARVRAWTVDDQTGDLYVVNVAGELHRMASDGTLKHGLNMDEVIAVQASERRIYAMRKDGQIHIHNGQSWASLGRSTVAANLIATQGHLYVLDVEKDLFHLVNGQWANSGKPIANNVKRITANGESWFGLDSARRVYSGELSRYIDRDGDAVAVTAIGRDLLLFTEDTKLYRFRMDERRWEGRQD